MKKYLVGLTFRYIESNHETFCILFEKQYNEYKKFFCEDCKSLAGTGECFGEDGEIDAEPGITIDEIQSSLENAIEINLDVQKALSLLSHILPSQTDALYYIKKEIIDKKYLEE